LDEGVPVRRTTALIALAIALAGCAGVRDRIAGAPLGAAGGFDPAELVDVLAPGAIPTIDQPSFESPASAAEHLLAADPVVVVEIDGDARAYPLAILVWHEIVNDVVGGEPVAVTYAPLTGSAAVFRRTIGGEVVRFGGSGKLHRANLVMYDRSPRPSLWPQLLGRAVLGPARGRELPTVPVRVSSFADFARGFPAGRVLTASTGAARVYGATPYAGYESRARPSASFFPGAADPRLPAKERVLGVRVGRESRAYPFARLRRAGALADRIGGREVVTLWSAGTVSPVDTPLIAEGRDVGAAAAYSPVLDGDRFDFEAAPGGFRDRQTGSIWSVLGTAVSGPLAGRRLEPVEQTVAFWFAWAASVPATTVYGAS
jgi:hypothetical protein